VGQRSSIAVIISSAHLTPSETALTVAGTFHTPSRSPHAGQDVYWATSLMTIGLQEKISRAFSCLEVYVAHKMLLGVLAITLAAMTLPSYGQAVTANVLRRTLLIKVASGYGTAFTIEVDNRQYIVTAKHVVNSVPDQAESTIHILNKSGWSPVRVKIFKCAEPVDVAVLVPPEQITVNFSLEPTSVGLMVGQDAYFVGFPYGHTFAKSYSNLPDIFGLVKKATVAQLDSMPASNAQRILLDGYNNPGFSGSPLVWRDVSQPGIVFKVAGVITSFESYVAPVSEKVEIQENQITAEDRAQNRILRTSDGKIYRLKDTGKVVQMNTGIATAWDIQSAVDLIRKHPVGPMAADSFTGEGNSAQSPAPQQ
jgi:Trypsin-like peptidase domain